MAEEDAGFQSMFVKYLPHQPPVSPKGMLGASRPEPSHSDSQMREQLPAVAWPTRERLCWGSNGQRLLGDLPRVMLGSQAGQKPLRTWESQSDSVSVWGTTALSPSPPLQVFWVSG